MDRAPISTSGFTLIELMMTLVVAAILATLAAPSFVDIIKNNRLSTQYNELLTHLSVARSEAISRNAEIKIQNNNGTASNVWDTGWSVYQDLDNDDVIDNGEAILVSGTPETTLTVRFDTLGTDGQISYLSNGLGNNTGTFIICDDRADNDNHARGLIIGTTGRTRAALDTDNNDIVDDGAPIPTDVSCP